MASPRNGTIQLGIGYYTVPEAARLLRVSSRSIIRWLSGYTYFARDKNSVEMPPLWTPQIAPYEDHIELGFRDLVELRFVKSFLDAGVGLLTIRNCLIYARTEIKDSHPLSTRRFQTDGKRIFFDSVQEGGERETLDIKTKQYVIRSAIDSTFKDLDIENDVAVRWRPFNGKASIIIDPGRSFGQPIATDYGMSTHALFDAVKAEGSVKSAARAYEVPVPIVRDAVKFEQSLRAA